ncbi:MAG: transposase [Tepidibacter sp.]|jgi:putative transposase|uniref:RNA-guided endonuclease InsQ/TnpB family protein n=1 Tax=Tepidibacter sp. TaxID=2529387 RepID=UPI0025F5B867|nr:transposase [Tepidibacter sp.]MCT4507308.1 transposase [Tepidibacter sp.]
MAKGKTKNILFGIQKQQLKNLSADEYKVIKELCFLSKNIYNVALYNVRQYFFTEKKYLSYESNYKLCKDNENYALLNSNSAQQTMKVVDRNFKSFFALIELAKKGSYQYSDIKLPKYLKRDSFFNLIFAEFSLKDGYFTIPMSTSFRRLYGKVKVKYPSNLIDKKIKEIRILPKSNARFFEIQYIYEIEESKETYNKNNSLAIDIGIDNLATCVTNSGKSFIIDGKKLKSINAHANKVNSKLQSIKDKQKIKTTTNRQKQLWNKRNNKVNDYLNKSAKIIIDYCINNDIGTLIIGYNPTIQQDSNIGKSNNQNFVNLPIGQLRDKLNYQCKRHNISFVEQEESYTSKADFLANDSIPTYKAFDNKAYTFSGKRVKRGLYKSNTNIIINADVNGALNILRKSNITKIDLQYKEYLSPKRINVS